MDQTSEDASIENTKSVDKSPSGLSWKTQLGILCVMLLLALGGMALSQASDKGAWEYWLLVVVVYAALGLWRRIRQENRPVQTLRKMMARELAHWVILLVFLAVLLMLERLEIVNRQSASDFAVLMLALTCCQVGIHFDWLLLIVGVVLTSMLIALSILEQYTIVLWIVMILIVLGAAAFFYFTKGKRTDVEQ